jgi:light-regulated signal transduction histidine kinase (bacteriophytochrome)
LASEVGADKYLRKPASIEVIVAALREVCAMPLAIPRAGELQEVEVLKEYSERLVAKLEEKNHQLAQANQTLKRSNEDLQQFAYIASHDLQTPLRNISGFVQLLQAKYADTLDQETADWIRRTAQSAEQMRNLIRDLLAYSQLDSPDQAFLPTPFRAIFDDAVAMLEASVHESAGKITCDELPTVMGEPSQLLQLTQNLIGNGLKYRGHEPPHIHVSASDDGNEWTFSVRDNGIGIAPKHQERIFQIFRRLHTQQEYPGTGIGLAVCRRVVHRHGGRIWVESEAGHGSVFYFTIPKIITS